MSLINDALKRADQSPQQTPPPPPPLPPATGEDDDDQPGWGIPVLLIVVAAVAAIFIGRPFAKSGKPDSTAAAATNDAAAAVQQAPAPPQTVVAHTNQTISEQDAGLFGPQLKVQGIFYNPAGSQAIVNGQTIVVGDFVEGYRVKAISKYAVTFTAPDGADKTVQLGD